MRFWFAWSGPRAYIGCGALLVLLGLVLLSPVIGWLIKALGWVAIVLGIIAIVLGILSWLAGRGRRFP